MPFNFFDKRSNNRSRSKRRGGWREGNPSVRKTSTAPIRLSRSRLEWAFWRHDKELWATWWNRWGNQTVPLRPRMSCCTRSYALVKSIPITTLHLATGAMPTPTSLWKRRHPDRDFSCHPPDRNFCPKAGPKPCGWCGGHRGISKMSHCEPLFEYVTHFSSCRICHFYSLS
jgi:hypothetical protein